ncbi:hypothetical protein [Hyphomicrobium sp. ghe19]|uniref:hypothetical protein n=1 Tax=Hyphomicrobium sp. ghe19 TaxID=2682968 RepID=UPI001366BA2E|nr:hypothetical protein HYPP_02375 [Hyphomicrobium sp. ghe19]
MADEDVNDWSVARQKWAGKMDNKRKARKERERKLATSIDRRSLKATDRDSIFSFRTNADLKPLATKLAKSRGLGIGELMESLVLAAAREQEADNA